MNARVEKLIARFREFAADYSPAELEAMVAEASPAERVSQQALRRAWKGTAKRPNQKTLRAIRNLLFAHQRLTREEWEGWAEGRPDVLVEETYTVAEAMQEPEEERIRFKASGVLIACLNDLFDREKADLDELAGLAERVIVREELGAEVEDDVAEWLEASRQKVARNGKTVSST